jgi:hypothetical protein
MQARVPCAGMLANASRCINVPPNQFSRTCAGELTATCAEYVRDQNREDSGGEQRRAHIEWNWWRRASSRLTVTASSALYAQLGREHRTLHITQHRSIESR